MLGTLMNRLSKHISSITLLIVYLIIYVAGNTWVDAYLPVNGKPFVLVMLVAIVILYEMYAHGYDHINNRLDKISRDIAIANLKQSVNALYNRFIQSGDEHITNEYTIIELMELCDIRKKYDVNSYTEDRLMFLKSKIKRNSIDNERLPKRQR